jgi:hypothetical protein
MATEKPKRGRPAGKKVAGSTEPASEAVQHKPTNTRPRGRPATKKIVADEGQKDALNALRARRDAALNAKKGQDSPAAPLPTAKPGLTSSTKKATNARTSSAAKAKAVVPVQRVRTPSPQRDTDEELYGLSPGGEASKLRLEARRQSTQQQPPPSALKAQGTPAVETSILALANFKRRPRQPSIIRMVQQTSELGNQSDFDETLRDLDDTLRDFDEFNPDDESTPLHLSKRKSDSFLVSKSLRKSAVEHPNSSSRKRKHADEDDEIQVPRSSPPLASSPPRNAHRIPTDSRESVSSSVPEQAIPSTEQGIQSEAELERYSDTMAPPLSSSDMSSPPRPRNVPKSRPEKRRKTSTQPEATTSRKTRLKKAPTISTAALQSLLPRARNQKRNTSKIDTYEIPSSDSAEVNVESMLVDSDDDELAQPTRRQRGMKATTRTPISKVDGNKVRKKKGVLKSPAPLSKSLALTTKEKRRRTYGRPQAEKENDDSMVISDDNSNSGEDEDEGGKNAKHRDSGVGMAASEELKAARKKFEEVDQWEMEFESVDLGGGQSSAAWR